MITVGQYLKDARLKRGYSLKKVESLTKIKTDFISMIEKNDWAKLPEYAIVSGFIKNLSLILDLDTSTVNALLRRDYPPKKISINPKPDIQSKFLWSPKMTFAVAIFAVTTLIFGYLVYEYIRFTSPPQITVISPKEDEIVVGDSVKVKGKTTTDVVITINNQPVLVDLNGDFETSISVSKETKSLQFVAVSRSGKVTELVREISVDSD